MEQHAVSTLVGEGVEGAVSDSRLYHEGGDRDAGLALVARRSYSSHQSYLSEKPKTCSYPGEERRRGEKRIDLPLFRLPTPIVNLVLNPTVDCFGRIKRWSSVASVVSSTSLCFHQLFFLLSSFM